MLIIGGFTGGIFDSIFGRPNADYSAGIQLQNGLSLQNNQANINKWFMQQSQAYNSEQAQIQRDWAQEMMWQQNNFNAQWNSQKAIDDRMRAAGRNPYLQGGTTGIVQSASPAGGSAPQSPSSSVGLPSAGMPSVSTSAIAGLSALSNAGVQAAQEQLLKENARSTAIDNQTRSIKNIAELKKLFGDAHGVDLDNYAKEVMNIFAKDMAEQDYINKLETNKNLKLQGASMGYTIAMQAEELKVLPTKLRLDICMTNAQLFSEYQRGKLTEAQYKHELIKSMLTDEQVKGQQKINENLDIKNYQDSLDYATASEIAGDLVRKAKAEADTVENNKYPRDVWQDSYKHSGGSWIRAPHVGFGWLPFTKF
nr:MAG: DNA pilot protein [Microvirus Sku15]